MGTTTAPRPRSPRPDEASTTTSQARSGAGRGRRLPLLRAAAAVALLAPGAARGEVAAIEVEGQRLLCQPQPWREQYPFPAEELELQLLRRAQGRGCSGPGTEPGYSGELEDVTWLAEDLKTVAGRIAIVEGSHCNFTRWQALSEDFLHKVNEAAKAEAVGVVFVSRLPAEMPMSGMNMMAYGVPSCHMPNWEWKKLEKLLAAKGTYASLKVNVKGLPMYVVEEEPVMRPPITKVDVVDRLMTKTFPASQSSFSPHTTGPVAGEIVRMRLRRGCLTTNVTACQLACWGKYDFTDPANSVVENREDLEGKVAFFDMQDLLGLDHDSFHSNACFHYFFHFPIFAAQSGAKGVLLGGTSDVQHVTPGPWALAYDMKIPTFNLNKIHSDVLSNLTAESAAGGQEGPKAQLPAVENRTAVPFFADAEEQLGSTKVGFFIPPVPAGHELAGDELFAGGAKHFECFAGQNLHNPRSHPGIGHPSEEGLQANQMPVAITRAGPSPACGDRTRCGECLKDHHTQIPRAGNKVPAPGGTPAPSDSILMVQEDEFPCFHSRSEFIAAAAVHQPKGVILVESGDRAHTIDTEVTYPFPSFSVDRTCHDRIQAATNNGLDHPVYGTFPPIADGVSQDAAITGLDTNDMAATQIEVLSPASIEGLYLAGQATFNPRPHGAVSAELVMGKASILCQHAHSCAQCDALDNPYGDHGRYAGKIVMVGFELQSSVPKSQSNAAAGTVHQVMFTDFCVAPWTNVGEELQELGAAAVLFVNHAEEGVHTYRQYGWHEDVKTPSFNIPLRTGVNFASQMKFGSPDPYRHGFSTNIDIALVLPRIEQNGLAAGELQAKTADQVPLGTLGALGDRSVLIEKPNLGPTGDNASGVLSVSKTPPGSKPGGGVAVYVGIVSGGIFMVACLLTARYYVSGYRNRRYEAFRGATPLAPAAGSNTAPDQTSGGNPNRVTPVTVEMVESLSPPEA